MQYIDRNDTIMWTTKTYHEDNCYLEKTEWTEILMSKMVIISSPFPTMGSIT